MSEDELSFVSADNAIMMLALTPLLSKACEDVLKFGKGFIRSVGRD